MRPRSSSLLALFGVLLLASCHGDPVDALLEGHPDVDVHLSMSVASTSLAVLPGATTTVDASITRLYGFTGGVDFALANVPSFVTATIGQQSTSGAVTTVTLTMKVGATAAPGSYMITVKGTASPNGATSAVLELKVVPKPAVGVAPAKQSLTIIRGGISPLAVALARTSFDDPITLSLVGNDGITLSGNAPVTGTSAALTLAVATTVAPGSYALTLRASAPGIDNGDAPVTVVVSPDALQLVPADAATLQASVVTSSVIVNRNGAPGPVDITVEGLPAGATASVPAGPATGATASVRVAVGAGVAVGSYTVTVRGRAAGQPDALGTFVLAVSASNVAMSLVPQSVTMLQGTTASSLLTLVRNAFNGAVSVQVTNVPAGISVAPTSPSLTGTQTTLVVSTDRALAPGDYVITVRAIPAPSSTDGPALDPVTTTLTVSVLPAPSGDGNVLLDWSRCAPPTWVAGQDGSGAWLPLTGTNGIYRLAVTSGRGGFAWADAGRQVTVRYATQGELSAAPIDLCPAVDTTTGITIHGTSGHLVSTERYEWHLGGAFAATALATPFFALYPVRPGTNDLFGYSSISGTSNLRGMIQRDVTLPDGGDLGLLSMNGEGSFPLTSVNTTVSGLLSEVLSYSLSFLTRAECTPALIYSVGTAALTGNPIIALRGVPPANTRPTDYHLFDVTALGTNSTRRISVATHDLVSRTVALPNSIVPTVGSSTGSYKRLSVGLPGIPAEDNGSLTLTYSDGTRTATVIASVAYAGHAALSLAMPELGGVAGFPASAGIPSGNGGNWTVSVTGSTNQAVCAEGSTRWSVTKTGVF